MNTTVLFLMLCSFVHAQEDIGSILTKIDQLYRQDFSTTKMEMEIVTPHWQRTLKMNVWTKGTKKTFVRIKYPKKDAGIATLRRGNDMWNFFPKINKVIKVPASMRMGSWMGSDFTNDDLVKEATLREDFNSKILKSSNKLHIKIESIPLESTTTIWGKIVSTVRKVDYIPVEQLFYNERGELARVCKFSKIKKLGGRTMPTIMELISKTKNGNRTIIRYVDADFKTKVHDRNFTRKNLQKRK